jgi:hypothetical protein
MICGLFFILPDTLNQVAKSNVNAKSSGFSLKKPMPRESTIVDSCDRSQQPFVSAAFVARRIWQGADEVDADCESTDHQLRLRFGREQAKVGQTDALDSQRVLVADRDCGFALRPKPQSHEAAPQ